MGALSGARLIAALVGAAALFGALFYAGWSINGDRLTARYLAQRDRDAAAQVAALAAQVKIATDALAIATRSLQEATNGYESARADLSAYRSTIAAQYGAVRLCRQPVAPAAAGGPGAGAPASAGGASSTAAAVLPDATGQDLASLAADAEELRQRAKLCRAYVEAVSEWAARLKAGAAPQTLH
jgi:hypothetical protein